MNTAGSLAKDVGIKSACDALVIPRASFYRWSDRDKHHMKDICRPVSPLALTGSERKDVLDIWHSSKSFLGNYYLSIILFAERN